LDRWLQVIHSDLAGLIQESSIQGAHYIATFIDDYSKYGVVYFLHMKDQCVAAFKKFLAWAENQTLDKLLALHSDCEGEYLTHTVKVILDEKGIDHRLTMLGSPQQNGLAEQWNHTLMEKACTILHSTGLSLSFWELAVDTAVHIYNRTPSCTINWRMPHELWNAGHIPDVSYFRIFRCKAYVHVPEGK
jgi:transposase InsO family protein